jgi:hypothetical protein
MIQVKHKQIDNAMKLAEKYVDFNTLVVLCEIKSDNDLLESYLDKFYDSVIIFELIFIGENLIDEFFLLLLDI